MVVDVLWWLLCCSGCCMICTDMSKTQNDENMASSQKNKQKLTTKRSIEMSIKSTQSVQHHPPSFDKAAVLLPWKVVMKCNRRGFNASFSCIITWESEVVYEKLRKNNRKYFKTKKKRFLCAHF